MISGLCKRNHLLKILGAGFRSYFRPVSLNCSHANTEVVRNCFVRHASSEQLEHIPLPTAERGKATHNAAVSYAPATSLSYGAFQALLINRLLKVIECAMVAYRIYCIPRGWPSRHKDDCHRGIDRPDLLGQSKALCATREHLGYDAMRRLQFVSVH